MLTMMTIMAVNQVGCSIETGDDGDDDDDDDDGVDDDS